jgi:hypothetical protein
VTAPPRSPATWIQTARGRAFDLAAPDPEDVDVHDIAHALSLQTRFCGHCAWHYSVAQHCVAVAGIVFATDPTLALGALLHDASEAYHADWSSPLKAILRTLAPDALNVEARIEAAIAARFGVLLRHPVIKAADLIMLATEKRDLFDALQPAYADRNQAAHWFAATGYAPATPLPGKIWEWAPRQAESEFLKAFERYGGK